MSPKSQRWVVLHLFRIASFWLCMFNIAFALALFKLGEDTTMNTVVAVVCAALYLFLNFTLPREENDE